MSTDAPVKPKPNVLRIIIYFVAGVIIMTTAVTNLLVVYVLFAPDTLPKPIYLVYQLPTGAAQQAVNIGVPDAGEPGANGGISNPLAIISGQSNSGEASQPSVKETTPSKGESPQNTEPVSPGQGIMIDTSTKIVNLAEPGGKKFIRVTATLEFDPPAGFTELPEEEKTAALTAFTTGINSKIPILDDTIVTILSAKDFQSVYTTEGKDALRQEIMDAVNGRLPEYKVIYVYFKEFVMQ